MFHGFVSKREVHMENGPIVKTLLAFTGPIFVSQILQQLYSVVDCAVIGHYCGEYGLAAAGLGAVLLSVITNFFIGFSTGISVIVSQKFGAYDYSSLKSTISTTVSLGFISGLVITIPALLLSDRIPGILSCPNEMIPDLLLYLRICLIGLVPMLVYNIGNAILRALGDTKSSLNYLVISCAVNLVLDIVFAAWLKLGIAGAATATLISQFVLLIMLMNRMLRCDKAYAYSVKQKWMPFSEIKELIDLSLPSGMQAIFMSFSTMILQVYINSFGPDAVAGLAVFQRVEGFLYFPSFSYGIALTGFAGQNYGARRMDRVRKAVGISVLLSVALIIPFSLFLIWVSPLALRFFTSSEGIIYYGSMAIRMIFPCYFLYTINQVYLGALKGLGKTGYPMVASLAAYCFVRILWTKLLMPSFHSMAVIYTGYDISWVVLILLLLPVYRKVRKERECEQQ